MKQLYSFLRELKLNNNRDWFNANKERYLHAKSEAERLTQDLINAVATVDPEAARLTPADCTYRIYRDTRFSPDKTPYKTHIGIFINPPGGKKALTGGYYFHLEPDNSLIAAGNICHPAPILKALRQAVFDEIDEYRSIVEDPAFLLHFSEIGENPLKTVPKGFPKDWPFLEYIKPRDFTVAGALPDSTLCRRDAAEALLPAIRQAARFNRFINFTIEDFI